MHDDESLFVWEPANTKTTQLTDQPAVRPEEGLSVFTTGNKGVMMIVPLHRVDTGFVKQGYSDCHFGNNRELKDVYLVLLNCTDRRNVK